MGLAATVWWKTRGVGYGIRGAVSVENAGSVGNAGSTVENAGSTVENAGSTVENAGSTVENAGSMVEKLVLILKIECYVMKKANA